MTMPGAIAFTAPSASTGDAVVLRGLSKSFAKQRGWRAVITGKARESVLALSDVSCDVRAGEFFGLLGENGAGKTTLFKILATLVIPDAGSATVGGHDVLKAPGRVRETLAPYDLMIVLGAAHGVGEQHPARLRGWVGRRRDEDDRAAPRRQRRRREGEVHADVA